MRRCNADPAFRFRYVMCVRAVGHERSWHPLNSRALDDSRACRYRGVESTQQKGGLAMKTRPPDFLTTLLPTPPRIVEIDRLGDEIAELSAHLEAATARLLDLIREFDARGGWNTGFSSCAAWLSWRVGFASGATREHVRVARALGTLPLLSHSLARGELSYAKGVDARGDPGDRGAAADGGPRRHRRARRANRAGLAPDGPQGRGPGGRPPACRPCAARVSRRGRHSEDPRAADPRGRCPS